MTTDVLLGSSDRRVLISGYGLPTPTPPPPPDSLLGRLDQIDLRLRQLEEQRRPAAVDDGEVAVAIEKRAARHQHTKSLPSALHHHQHSVQARGTLMDRLNLLESRIRQLSCELDLDIMSGKGTTSSSLAPPPPVAAEDPAAAAWSDTAPMLVEPAVMMSAAAADGRWSAVDILQRGARQLHRSKSKSKVKNLKEAKCACQKDKRKAERGRPTRRWFTVGC